MPTVFADKAEHAVRYPEGSHIMSSELYAIHVPSELKAPFWYRELWGSITLGIVFEDDDAPAMVPISAWRHEQVVLNDM